MFVTDNNASFHLWLKESLVKHQKVSNYYDHDCLQNFLFLFISLLTAPIVKNKCILAGIFFLFLKKQHKQNLKDF